MSKGKLLFSVTARDCDFQPFRGTGAGGQKKNKTSSAIRCVHRDSGAVGTCQEHRQQTLNKQTAFARMAATETFRKWHRIETARQLGRPSVDDLVEAAMHPKNIKVEFRTSEGWKEEMKPPLTDTEDRNAD